MMKRIVLVTLAICTLAIALGLTIDGFNPPRYSRIGDNRVTSVLAPTVGLGQIITGTGDVPIYPGARTVSVTEDRASLAAGAVEYHANLSNVTLDQTAAFYRNWLAKNNWVTTSEKVDQEQAMIRATWINAMEGPPAERYIELGIQTVASGQTELHVWHQRWPDVGKVPLLPGAQNEQTIWQKDPIYDYLRVTTYTTDKTVAAVNSYYANILPQYGWGETSAEFHLIGTAYRGKGSTIVVKIESSAPYQTIVTLQIYGAAIVPPAKN